MEQLTTSELAAKLSELQLSLTDCEQLFAVSDALADSYRLRAMLSDPALAPSTRGVLAEKLFAGQLTANALKAVQELCQAIVNSAQLAKAVEQLALRGAISASADPLELEERLFVLARTIEADGKLQNALRDDSYSLAKRQQLVADLLSAASDEIVLMLARRAVQARGGSIVATLTSYIELAAEIRNHRVAIVTTAIALSEQQRAQLAEQLYRIYGYRVDIQSHIDPKILGGVRIEVGDDEIDGTIRNKIEQAKSQIG